MVEIRGNQGEGAEGNEEREIEWRGRMKLTGLGEEMMG